jgi:hypothetical protein
LHESTRKFILVLIFFAIGPLLTLLIAAGIILRKVSSNVDYYERSAALTTGLKWEIDAIEYRKSNQIRLKNVRLFRTGFSKPFFAASEVNLSYISGGGFKGDRNNFFPGAISSQVGGGGKNSVKGISGSGSSRIFGSINRFLGTGGREDGFWHISVARSLVDLGDSVSGNECNAELRECFLELASRMEELSREPVFITFDEVDVIATSLKRFKLRFVTGSLYQTELAIRSEWGFFIPIVSETEREQVMIVRRRNSRSLSVTLKTGNMPLPCEMVAIFCSPFRYFGASPSRVCGEITAEVERLGGRGGGIGGGFVSGGKVNGGSGDSGDGGDSGGDSNWTYSLRSVFFNDIDIASIMSGSMPYILNGKIKGLRVNEALLGGGRLQANGWIEVVDGVIERGLFHRLVEQFSLTVLPASILELPCSEYPFTRCVFNYRLRHDGVIFWVERSSEIAGNVFMSNEGDGVQTQPMAVSLPNGDGKLVSYHSVLSIFASDSAPIIPLTPFSKFFVPFIPIDEPAVIKNTNQNQN